MRNPGIVTLGGHEVGSFELDHKDRVVISFYKGAAGVEETLEFASEQGMTLCLMLKPDFNQGDAS